MQWIIARDGKASLYIVTKSDIHVIRSQYKTLYVYNIKDIAQLTWYASFG